MAAVELVAATANPGKLAELAAVLEGAGVVLRPRPPALGDVDETGTTLEANAEMKARAVAVASGGLAVADDTGLEVDALDGAPGVRSARFAGDDATDADNVTLLLARLDGVPTERRTARFRTVICVAAADGPAMFATGVCEGTIATARSGDGGFGYDPVFVPLDGDGRTFAQMGRHEKNAISHRGRALRAAAERLPDHLRGDGG